VLTSMPLDRDPRRRGQRSIAMDLKQPAALAILEDMIRQSDVLMEGMRPGAAEDMGLSPARCAELNHGLIYARITGWGQQGPLASTAGHDINYIALSGALHAMGDADRPPPVPLNLLGDYAGGGMYVAFGIVSALFERRGSGLGQVIDGAIADGVASLTTATMGMLGSGLWAGRGDNVLDGGAPFYRTYRCADGEFVAVGAIEPKFFAELLLCLGMEPDAWDQNNRDQWPALRDEFAGIFATHSRAHWTARFAASDACVSPVLHFDEAAAHPHHRQRDTYIELDGITQAAPGPRMSAHHPGHPTSPPGAGLHTDDILREMGRSVSEIAQLKTSGIVI
jgi:alpha-methylacyl-CoA racemase